MAKNKTLGTVKIASNGQHRKKSKRAAENWQQNAKDYCKKPAELCATIDGKWQYQKHFNLGISAFQI